jgi:phospholipid/cholesterol/gamma-HCH transport system substrate-binding protein
LITDKIKNILIGLFFVAAVTIAISMILFLEPAIGDGKKHLRVRFTNISGIAIGTRVTFAGKPVGEVLHIHEIKEARNGAPDDAGRFYFYELVLKTDSSVEIYSSDEIAVGSTGLMGEKSVAIRPKQGKEARIITDEIIYASSIDPFENTLNQMTKTAGRIEKTVDRFDQWLAFNAEPLSHTIQTLGSALGRIDHTLAAVDQQKIVPALHDAIDLLNSNLQSIQSSFQEDQLLYKIGSLTENLDTAARLFNDEGAPAIRYLHQIARDMATGSGTLGRFIARDDFYLQISSLLSKADTLMNDINHYGILFQYDKHWQKSRTKKANLLKALDTPKEFRNYFEGEIDAVTTSLGRLSELLERAEGMDEKTKIAESEYFKKQFAILLRSAQSLTDTIKLYNEGLMVQSELQDSAQ